MNTAQELAPPVVTVTIVWQPGPWFDDVLEGLAEQDFQNLKHLFLIVGEPGTLPDRIRAKVPQCFVRAIPGDATFGTACNHVLSLVEGNNGFFCFLHDDVALDPSAIRLLVDEVYRSNAGVVGPKLVDWDDPTVLQHVGLAVDHFGGIDPLIEPGEVDQEQHDAVRDVFALPTACMLVRADLFRTIGGFDEALSWYGDDLDLCWRAHLSGARVVVVPSARARHREALGQRRPDLRPARLIAQHRMRSVATLTGARRLPLRLVQLLAITLVELVVGIFTGTVRTAWESLKAFGGLIPRLGSIISRRRAVSPLRQVPESEVVGLQLRGSARLASYMRSRDARPIDSEVTQERRWRESAGSLPSIAWLAIIGLTIFGSRQIITGGVPRFGQMLAFDESPRRMLSDYFAAWQPTGLGSTSASPTGLAVVALGSTATLFHMGLWHTVTVLGLLVAGFAGMWRLASIYSMARARVTALAVYAFVPLPSSLLAHGRWGALAAYAATPWVLHTLRRAVGIDTRGVPATPTHDFRLTVARRKQVRLGAQLAIIIGLVVAFAPTYLLVVAIMVVSLAVATIAAGGWWRTALDMLIWGAVGIAGAFVLNIPWSLEWFRGAWGASFGVDGLDAPSIGLLNVMTFDLASWPLVVLAAALYLPLLAGPLIADSWRFIWAVRAAVVASVFVALAAAADRDALGVRLPEPGVLLVPVAVSMALAAACLMQAFSSDVKGKAFGIRQPLAVVSIVAVVVGVVPGFVASLDGGWRMPELTLQSALAQLPDDADGDYRVLWIGDPRVMPVAGWEYQAGISYALTDDGPIELEDNWVGAPSPAEDAVADALRSMASGLTLRGGRLLAPYGIRYIIVPVADDAVSSVSRPLPVPIGLTDALNDQLDLGQPLVRPLNYHIYVNSAWVPTLAALTPEGADASRQAGFSAIAQSELTGSVALPLADQLPGGITVDATGGTVQFGVPFDQRWTASVNGVTLAPRPSFGTTVAFDNVPPGSLTISMPRSAGRTVLLVAQALLWVMAVLLGSRLTATRLRRRASDAQTDTVDADGPLLDLGTTDIDVAELDPVET